MRYFLSKRASNYTTQNEADKKSLIELGAKKIRFVYPYGLSNQPKVYTFEGNETVMNRIDSTFQDRFLILPHWKAKD